MAASISARPMPRPCQASSTATLPSIQPPGEAARRKETLPSTWSPSSQTKPPIELASIPNSSIASAPPRLTRRICRST